LQFLDLYQLLGVARNASAEEIKKAFRELARDLHPDISPLPDAKERFQVLNEAYQILADPIRRRFYNLQFDRHQALIKSRQEKVADESLFEEVIPEFRPPRTRHPRKPRPEPRTRSTVRKSGEPYVSMAQKRQKHFVRYIPTIRNIAVAIWIFLAVQIVDRIYTTVGEIERVEYTELRQKRLSGLVLEVSTGHSSFREDSFGYLDLEPPDLVQFERTWLLKRNTEMLLIFSPFPTPDKVIGKVYPNRIFYAWYVLTLLLLSCSLAAFFVPDEHAELRFKFGLACLFFFLFDMGIQFVF
jgi:hypothetical protein